MGVGQQRRSNQGPPSSAGNPDQQQSRPSAPPSVAQSASGRPPSGGYDGPASEPRKNPFGPGLGFDPARDKGKEEKKFNTRVELPCYIDPVSNTFCLLICCVWL